MAGQPSPGDEQQLKQRAMRRLAMALGLIAAAIVGLAVLDHYSGQKSARAPTPPPAEAPPTAALPEPAPGAPSPPPSVAQPPSPPATEPTPARPPPPPPSVAEETVLPSARTPATTAPPAAEVPEDSAAAAAGQPAPRAPATQPPPKAAAAPTLESRQGFVVQLGVFTTVEHAQSLHARLRQQGIPAFLETRVVVGPFRDRAEAEAAQRKLKALGISGVIVQRK